MIRLGINTTKRTFHKKQKEITREELNIYIEEYFARGGQITQIKLAPNEAYEVHGSIAGVIGDIDQRISVKETFPANSNYIYQTFQGRIL